MLTQDQIAAIYEKAIDNQPAAGLDVTEADKDVSRALDAYCSALQYETFLWAYELGYKAGRTADQMPGEDDPTMQEQDEDEAERSEEEGWI